MSQSPSRRAAIDASGTPQSPLRPSPNPNPNPAPAHKMTKPSANNFLRRRSRPLSVAVIAVFLVMLVELSPLGVFRLPRSRGDLSLLATTSSVLSSSSPGDVVSTAARAPNGTASAQGARPEVCLVYDRPPRTGSSTAGRALQECWSSLGFNVVNKERLPTFRETFLRMVESGDAYVAAASNHIYLEQEQLDILYNGCKRVFYITSTRPMRGRIISAALGSVEKHNFTLAENVTMSDDDLPTAKRLIEKMRNTWEMRMERYPFEKGAGERVVKPDYVIRYDEFDDDLIGLREAFGCTGAYETVNVHVVGDADDQEEQQEDDASRASTMLDDYKIPLRFKDRRHRRMSNWAQSLNQDGLNKAAELALLRKEADPINPISRLISSFVEG